MFRPGGAALPKDAKIAGNSGRVMAPDNRKLLECTNMDFDPGVAAPSAGAGCCKSRFNSGLDGLNIVFKRVLSLAVVLFALLTLSFSSGGASAQEVASDWVEGHNVRTRLVIGTLKPNDTNESPSKGVTNPAIVAGLEMELAEGWKTYWRNPGEAGGVPPEFDWSGSTNVAMAEVRYPGPQRITDKAGSTIGYKKHVVFPVHVTPDKVGETATLKLQFAFGVCKNICVPSEGTYEVTLAAGNAPPLPATLVEALSRVPAEGAGRPRIEKIETALATDPPKVTMHVSFPAGTAGADVFVEGPPGEYVPMTKVKGRHGENTLIYEIDLSEGADVESLKGKTLRATIVSDKASSETQFKLQ